MGFDAGFQFPHILIVFEEFCYRFVIQFWRLVDGSSRRRFGF
jgi:hypothetical protein